MLLLWNNKSTALSILSKLEKSHVIVLNETNFDDLVLKSDQGWLIYFYNQTAE